MGNHTDKPWITCRGLILLCIPALLLGLILFYTTYPSVSAQTPTSTCSQPEDVDIAFAFCDAAHDDIADDYAFPLRDVSTDGYISPIILKAVGAYESTWTQCNADGTPFGPTGCDWGIMQIWSGMNCDAPENQFNSQTQYQVKNDYRYNIGMGAYILKKWKWDWHEQNDRIIGDGDPRIPEHWYYAVWSYYQWTFDACPNNPVYDQCDFPNNLVNCAYVDRVWAQTHNPPTRDGYQFFAAVNLTRPDRSLFPRYQYQWDTWDWYIGDPLPVHRDWCRSYLPVVLKNYPPCAQPIQNGDFEAGSAYWTLGGATTISTMTPHSGSYSARLGGYNNANDTLYQTVTIPTTGSTGQPVVSAHLSYYWYMTTEEFSTLYDYDYLYVRIRDAYGYTLREVETLTNRSSEDAWGFSSFDVSEFIGQTIQVHFQAITDGSLKTSFFIDDVSLYACEGG